MREPRFSQVFVPSDPWRLSFSASRQPRRIHDCEVLTEVRILYIYTAMTLPVGPDGKYDLPKLTASQLRDLCRASPSKDVTRTLAWEVFRLRRLVVRADQLDRSLDGGCLESRNFIRACWHRETAGEPCIAEHNVRVHDLFYGSGEAGQDDGRQG